MVTADPLKYLVKGSSNWWQKLSAELRGKHVLTGNKNLGEYLYHKLNGSKVLVKSKKDKNLYVKIHVLSVVQIEGKHVIQ